MAEQPKNIGELFKRSFEEMEVKGDSSDWSMLEMKLERLKFFKFGFTYFNIYYASIIALTFMISSAVGINQILVHNNPPEMVRADENKQYSDTANPGQQEKGNPVLKDEETFVKPKRKKEDPIKPNGDEKDELSPAIINNTSADSSHIPTILPAKKKEEKPKVPEKKIVFITKQDTLIVVDTIKTSKKRKK